MGIWYAKREQILLSLSASYSAFNAARIDPKIDAASRSLEGFLHRRFYPERRTIQLDWPNNNSSPTWQVDLQNNEIISLEAVTSGGTNILAGCYLSRADNVAEPPYRFLNIDLSTDYSLSVGSTWQRSLNITGLFGNNDTATVTPGAVLNGAIASTSTTSIAMKPSSGIFTVGVGSLLKIDSERMVVVNRQMVTTTRTTTSSLLATQAAKTFTCANASEFATGETILIDSERMRIEDIAGTTITVTRAVDSTLLEAHSSGATIYALRQFIVQRGTLGSTAATHLDAASVYDHEYPGIINELCVAETIVMLEQGSAGYARTVGTGSREIEAANAGLGDVRERAYRAYGRMGRLGTV